MIYKEISSVFFLRFQKENEKEFSAPCIVDGKTGYILGCDNENAFILNSDQLFKERLITEGTEEAQPIVSTTAIPDDAYLRALIFDAPIEASVDESQQVANAVRAMNKVTQFFTTITKR